MDEWVLSIRVYTDADHAPPPTPVSSRLSLYPQMSADPVHGHPPWALVLVAVSVGES